MRSRAYATLRTVPSGGARHAFETYLVVRYVEGLRPRRVSLPAAGACARVSAPRRAARGRRFRHALRPELGGKGQRDLLLVRCALSRGVALRPYAMRRCSSMPGMWAKISISPARRRASAPAACARLPP